jgi:hypothetical protein
VTIPKPLPAWVWEWMLWVDAGRPRGKRPKSAPKRIPAWAWERYRIHKPPAKSVPPPVRRLSRLSPFAGIGAFTAWDPRAALQLKGLVDWVAIQGDPEGGATPDTIAALEQAGFAVYVWKARAGEHTRPAGMSEQAWDDTSDWAFIGQAEAQDQLEACLASALAFPLNKGLVGDPNAWTPEGIAQAKAQSWDLLLEWYGTDQPWLTFDKLDSRGYPVTSFVIGVYHDYPLQRALDQMPRGVSFSIYLAESMLPPDVEALRKWRAA